MTNRRAAARAFRRAVLLFGHGLVDGSARTHEPRATVASFREALARADDDEKARLLGKLMREARDQDVWHFTTVTEVRALWPKIERYLGRRRAFWVYLLEAWQRDGIGLVRDRTPAVRPKTEADGVRMDSIEEIVANKIAALVGRSEIRDLVDLLALERRGYRLEDYLDDAKKKDAGVSPATIAWLLSSVHAPAHVEGATQAELESFVRDLERRMLALAKPSATR